jgi:hypothetical protein
MLYYIIRTQENLQNRKVNKHQKQFLSKFTKSKSKQTLQTVFVKIRSKDNVVLPLKNLLSTLTVSLHSSDAENTKET